MSKRWNTIDEKKIIELYSSGKTYEHIGKQLNRTPNAIKLRLELIVYDNINKGKTIKLLSQQLKTTEDNIKKLYYSHKSFIETKESKESKTSTTSTTNINTQNKLENENNMYEILIKNYELKQKIKKLYTPEQLEKLIKKYF